MALACQPTYVPHIEDGRRRVAAMPREWALANIEAAARSTLDLDDYWAYSRLLELLDHIGAHAQVRAMVSEGLASSDADVRDAAESWADRWRPAAG